MGSGAAAGGRTSFMRESKFGGLLAFYRRRLSLALTLSLCAGREEALMQIIVVANPKGGSGKTTLATNAAGWLAGKRQHVALQDLDPQRSSAEWLARRPTLFPQIGGAGPETKSRDLKDAGKQWLVVDTPAGLHGDDLRDAIKRAD